MAPTRLGSTRSSRRTRASRTSPPVANSSSRSRAIATKSRTSSSDLRAASERAATEFAESWRLPAGAIAKFGAYASGLQESSERANLVGILDGDRFAEELLLDSLRALPLLDRLGESGSIIDVGSGAGLPGIPLAIARPTWKITCLEPRLKRARFLTTAKVMVGLPHVEVIQGRLEEQERTWDVACSRAVFEPMLWLELALPIVREQGHLLCYATERNKPLGAEAERLGWSEVAEVTYPGPGGDRVVLLYRRS